MGRVTEYRTDPDLCELLVTRSKATMLWLRQKGVRFVPIWGRQAYRIGGRFKFWGGLTVEAWGGGPGLVDSLTAIAHRQISFHGRLCTSYTTAPATGRPARARPRSRLAPEHVPLQSTHCEWSVPNIGASAWEGKEPPDSGGCVHGRVSYRRKSGRPGHMGGLALCDPLQKSHLLAKRRNLQKFNQGTWP